MTPTIQLLLCALGLALAGAAVWAEENFWKRLGGYWSLVCLAVCFQAIRYRNQLLAKLLLLLVAVLKFQREHLQGIFNGFAWYVAHRFFGWPKGEAPKMNNAHPVEQP